MSARKSAWHIEFAPQPSLLRRGLAVMSAAALVALVFAFQSYREAANLYADTAARVMAHQAGADEAGSAASIAAEEANKKDDLPAIIRKLSVPWIPLLAHISAASGQGVEILSIEPDATEATLKIVAESREMENMLAFMERLESGGVLSGVHIAQHQLVEHQNGTQSTEFELRAKWVAFNAAAGVTDQR